MDDAEDEKLSQAESLKVFPPPQPGVFAQFVATTNKVTAEKVQGWRSRMSDIWQQSDAFKSELGSDSVKILWQTGNPSELAVHAPKGFVSAVIDAYCEHHELTIRPDDVWQAILVQFSFYVNAHAEELRSKFVSFEGRMQLEVQNREGTLKSLDYGRLVKRTVEEKIMKHVDTDLVEWLLPSFSTTTDTDRTAACLSVMATMQQYFSYGFRCVCGIPKVTLMGERADWLKLRAKIDRLLDFETTERATKTARKELGEGWSSKTGMMSKWHSLLAPVLDKLVEAGDGDEAKMQSWWDQVFDHTFMDGGPYKRRDDVTGWITAFAVFSSKGVWRGNVKAGMPWPRIRTEGLPLAVVSAPVVVVEGRRSTTIRLFAGQVAYNVSSDGRTIIPRSDMCVTVDPSKD